MPFIKVTDGNDIPTLINLNTVSRIVKLPNGKADIFWADKDYYLETLETFEEVSEAIQIASSSTIVPAKPEPSSYEKGGMFGV